MILASENSMENYNYIVYSIISLASGQIKCVFKIWGVLPKKVGGVCIVNIGKLLGNLAKFFVLCSCLLFWTLTLHKSCAHTTNQEQQNDYVIRA